MTKIHSGYYDRVAEYELVNGSTLVLEAKSDDDGTVWVRVVKESPTSKRLGKLMSDNLELV